MYISVDTLMSAEHPLYRFNNFKVYLDGVEQKRVFACDTLGDFHHETGWVDRYAEDRQGMPIVAGMELLTERVYGHVEIKMKWEDV